MCVFRLLYEMHVEAVYNSTAAVTLFTAVTWIVELAGIGQLARNGLVSDLMVVYLEWPRNNALEKTAEDCRIQLPACIRGRERVMCCDVSD